MLACPWMRMGTLFFHDLPIWGSVFIVLFEETVSQLGVFVADGMYGQACPVAVHYNRLLLQQTVDGYSCNVSALACAAGRSTLRGAPWAAARCTGTS